MGAVAGASFGRNVDGTIVGAIAGAVVGSLIAASVEHETATKAYEYIIETENGATVTLVQGDPALPVGSRIILLYGSPARLIPDPDGNP